jgi:hypothetical protein
MSCFVSDSFAFRILALPTRRFPPWRAWKYGPETWEHVVYFDTWNRLVSTRRPFGLLFCHLLS